MENFIGHISFQSFSPQFPGPAATSETPGLVAMRGWKTKEDVTENYFFKKKKKSDEKLNLTESSVCI